VSSEGGDEPAAGEPLRAAAKVAARERRDHSVRAYCECCEQLAMAVVEPVAEGCQLTAGGVAGVLRQ
jgi:hypothetical protein